MRDPFGLKGVIVRLGVLLGLAALTQWAQAGPANYIFYASQPLVMVTEGGDFASFSESDLGQRDDDSGRFRKNERLAKKFRKLWVYSETGSPSQVGASIGEDYVGCELAAVIKTEYEVAGSLLSSRPVRARHREMREGDLQRMVADGKRLLAAALRRHKVPAVRIARAVETTEVMPVHLDGKGATALALAANLGDAQQTLSALLIAMPGKDGRYAISREEVSVGGASDSEDYAGEWKLGAHLDLNEDGAEELLLDHSGYESFSTLLWHWDGREWRDVGRNGGGC
ncbi:hypothetical protein [Niveibacterium sp. SC-1]|uniref:hypothetical protein n=1 Tax=Niveibacterium sp. SC-1 TaxID=3135646 RepID=UPI00311FD578